MRLDIAILRKWLNSTEGMLGEGSITGISTDSRTIKRGDLFIPLKGENFDGHEFVGAAFAGGAAAALAERGGRASNLQPPTSNPPPIIEVNDPLLALQEIAKRWREGLDNLKVIAITGSTGKTSTKDILVALLRERSIIFTEGSRNNEIGVPTTLLEADESTEMAVIEIGMRGLGQIASLCEVSSPSVGVITNVGPSHIELLGSVENVYLGKKELVDFLSADATAVLNADDSYFQRVSSGCSAKIVSFGIENKADFSAHSIVNDSKGTEFICRSESKTAKIRSNLTGIHQVYNFLAAIATAASVGVDLDEALYFFKDVELSENRGQLIELGNDVLLIDDCYNANPISMKAAIDNLAALAGGSKTIAVLGDMAELGEGSVGYHREIGTYLAFTGIDALVTVGELSRETARAAKEHGVKTVIICNDVDEACEELNGLAEPGSVVLVKASRFLRLERLVDKLREKVNELI